MYPVIRRRREGAVAAVAALAALLLLGALPAARAQVSLPVGSDVTPNAFNPAPGAVLASVTNGFSSVSFTGTLTTAVVRNEVGTLDFYYQVLNNAGSTSSLGRVSAFPFDVNFTTSVFYRTDNGGGVAGFQVGTETPDSADRHAGGEVGFHFLEGPDPATSGKVSPGERTSILVIRTSAQNFTTGIASVINGGAATVSAFAPASGVAQADIPEPGTILLFCVGLLPLAAALRRRRPAAKAA